MSFQIGDEVSVLDDDTVFSYKCDNFYDKPSERGIIYNDETLRLDWQLSEDKIIVSEKDLELPSLNEYIKWIADKQFVNEPKIHSIFQFIKY